MHSISKWNVSYLWIFSFLSICSSWAFRNGQIELIFWHEICAKCLQQYTRTGDFNLFFEIAIIIIKVSLVLCVCIASVAEKATEQKKRGKKLELLAYSHKHDTPLNLVATLGACLLRNISEGNTGDSRTENTTLIESQSAEKQHCFRKGKQSSRSVVFLKVSTNKAHLSRLARFLDTFG